MLKSKKLKNPCKICLQSVTLKNGIQCQGACQTWAHFTCLNYTPGKIKDIKKGVIKVNCPCPDCHPAPKEYRTDETFSCTNIHCPANLLPACANLESPSQFEYPTKMPCSLTECVRTSSQKHGSNPTNAKPWQNISGSVCTSGCPSCSSSVDVSGDVHGSGEANLSPALQAVEEMCHTVGQLTRQINDLMVKMKQAMQGQEGGSRGKTGCCRKKHRKCKKGPKTQSY